MCKRILTASLVIFLAALMSGCYTLSIVSFGNGTTTSLKVRSCQTGQEIEVKPGTFEQLPHSTGDLIVTVHSDGRFRFSDVEPPALDVTNADYLTKKTSAFGPGKVILRVKLETNMQLYAVMPGRKGVDFTVKQPTGFPKSGQRVVQ